MGIYSGSLADFTYTDFIINNSSGNNSMAMPCSSSRGFIVFPGGENTEAYTQPIIMPQIYTIDGTVVGRIAHYILHCTNYFFGSEFPDSVIQTYRWKLGISWAVLKPGGSRAKLDASPTFYDEQTSLVNISRFAGDIFRRERFIYNPECDSVQAGDLFQIRIRRLGADPQDNLSATPENPDILIPGLSLYETDD